ncbi:MULTISPECIES: ATP-binding domain-containing protein [Rhizobium]|uniref:ATP-binding domain-containing protein n=1 Tax=Rhizobium TaxID=379 RepID=UPI00103C061E|nr:ATP-binding domain-containing protein [Rhizobium leguminosarum]TBZ57089.1 RNA helicase [Rhizobium leguminosarum bv. viciae]
MSTWWKKTSDLDDDQKKVISLPKEGDHLVLGPAGCGKTNLLLLRATFLVKAGVTNITVLTFGRVLKEFLVAGSTHYPFSSDKIQTYLQWGASLLASNGISFDDSGEFAEVRARLLEGLKDVAALNKSINVMDCILLDEAQDYSAEEIEVISCFAEQIYAVGDDRQRVTSAKGGLNALETKCGKPVVLKKHYRNGIKICRVADGIRNEIDSEEGMEATSKYNEKDFESSVIPYPGLSLADQVATAIPEIETQLFAYPDETIGILCPKQEDATTVAAFLLSSKVKDQVQMQNFAGGYSAFEPNKRVIVTTIISAKGLEFRAVHLLGMEMISRFRDLQKNLAFTGVTRAKTSLRIYYDKSIPGYLEKGILALNDASTSDPTLDELFG